MTTQTPRASIDISALNVSLSQAVVPLFWGAIAIAAITPIAAAAGGWVAGKIAGNSNENYRDKKK